MTSPTRPIGARDPEAHRPRGRGNAFAGLDRIIGRIRDPDAAASYTALENVVALAKPRQCGSPGAASEINIATGDRPAPLRLHNETLRRSAFILLASLLAHAALYAAFSLEPTPTASIAEEAITVEIVVGANSAAGTADVPSETEVESRASTAAQQVDTVIPQQPEPMIERAPQEQAAAPTQEPVPTVEKEITPPEQKVEEPPPPDAKVEDRPRPMPKPSPPSTPAANSVGRGRMAGDVNYQGLVAARLARHKRFPPEARSRREQGSAVVSFGIDGEGRVTSVRLVRKTGYAALDQEVEAMVWRASPFPAPPAGVAVSFSAPVSFQLN